VAGTSLIRRRRPPPMAGRRRSGPLPARGQQANRPWQAPPIQPIHDARRAGRAAPCRRNDRGFAGTEVSPRCRVSLVAGGSTHYQHLCKVHASRVACRAERAGDGAVVLRVLVCETPESSPAQQVKLRAGDAGFRPAGGSPITSSLLLKPDLAAGSRQELEALRRPWRSCDQASKRIHDASAQQCARLGGPGARACARRPCSAGKRQEHEPCCWWGMSTKEVMLAGPKVREILVECRCSSVRG